MLDYKIAGLSPLPFSADDWIYPSRLTRAIVELGESKAATNEEWAPHIFCPKYSGPLNALLLPPPPKHEHSP